MERFGMPRVSLAGVAVVVLGGVGDAFAHMLAWSPSAQEAGHVVVLFGMVLTLGGILAVEVRRAVR